MLALGFVSLVLRLEDDAAVETTLVLCNSLLHSTAATWPPEPQSSVDTLEDCSKIPSPTREGVGA